ncbi:MFS transporter [Rhodococcus sp. G-MC3]|uniref:MFS transporter n=1 Tax=Rhodococcus sp. G-MC3 TaxID=3046209 RepID=UPI0024BA5B4F|nr:MFS transporter [Rhodococcus sp. G-MC3]MDJ0396676.1 MFS transporter [Rhodococcus sp. G-MC3]
MTTPRQTTPGQQNSRRGANTDSLPIAALLPLAATALLTIVTETLPAGLLLQISSGLSISSSAAGQMVSAYALGAVIAAIPAITLTRGMRRKPILLAVVAGMLLANSITATVDIFAVTLVARFVAGAFSGVLWGMLAGYTRKISPAAKTGKALAIAMAGTTIAFAIGTPLGTYLGSMFGWRWAFLTLAAFAAVLIAWIIVAVPDAPGQPPQTRTPLHRVFATPGVAAILFIVFGWFLAHNMLYTYIAPFLVSVNAGLRIEIVLFVFGIASLAGIVLTGTVIDRSLRKMVLASLTAFATAALALGIAGGNTVVLLIAVVLWGGTFAGASTLMQTALADTTGPDADVANSMLTVAANLAIFGAGTTGGVLLDATGAGVFPWAALFVIATVFAIAFLARRHAIVPGSRVDRVGSQSKK